MNKHFESLLNEPNISFYKSNNGQVLNIAIEPYNQEITTSYANRLVKRLVTHAERIKEHFNLRCLSDTNISVNNHIFDAWASEVALNQINKDTQVISKY